MQACREIGLSPIDVMFESMEFWYRKASAHLGQMELCRLWLQAQLTDPGAPELDEKKRDEIIALVQNYSDHISAFREAEPNAVARAISSAPYVHPRLAAIAVKSDVAVNPGPVELNPNMTVEEKQRAYAEELRRHGPNI